MSEGVDLGSAYGSIRIDVSKLRTDLQGGGADLRDFQRQAEASAGGAQASFREVEDAGKKVALALAGVAAAGTALIRSSVMTAARTQVLGTVLYQVGKNAGYTATQLDEQVSRVKALGITTQEARSAVVKFIQAQLDATKAAALARVAQDLAVIAGENSSQAFSTLTDAIIAQRPILLKQYGIIQGLDQIYGTYAKTHGLVATALDETQKKEAFLQAILTAGEKVSGSYTAAMGDVGKQLTSLPRYFEEAKNALGQSFLPALSAGVQGVTGLLKAFLGLGTGNQAFVATLVGAATVMATLGSVAMLVVPKILALRTALMTLAAAGGGMGGGLMLVMGIIGAIVALGAAIDAKEKAQRQEAATLATSAASYADYIEKVNEAGEANYALSESLYNLVRAQDEATQAEFAKQLAEGQKWLESEVTWLQNTATAEFDMSAALGVGIEKLEAHQLAVMADRDAVMQVLIARGMSIEAARTEAAEINELAAVEQKHRGEVAQARADAVEMAAAYEAEQRALARAGGTMDDYYQRLQAAASAQQEVQEQLSALADEVGLSTEEVIRLKGELGYTNEEIEDYAENLHLTGGEIDDLAGSTGLSREAIITLNREFGLGQGEIEAYAEALEEARRTQLELISAWSAGLTGLTDFQQEVKDSAEDYQEALANLNRDTGSKLADVKKKFQDALPEPTDMAHRVDSLVDVWDEWALRMGALMDGVQGGQEQGWLSTLMSMTAGTELAFRQNQETLQGWLERLKTAFYAGKLPDLIDKDAPGYKEWAAEVDAQQKAATDAVRREAGVRRAELEKERQEQLAAEKKKYGELLVQTALSIAEQSGLLEQWSSQRFTGPQVEFFSEAENVFQAIQNGMIPLDASLGNLINTVIPGIGTAFEQAKSTATANTITIDDIMSGDWQADIDARRQAIVDAMSTIGDDIDPASLIPSLAERQAQVGEGAGPTLADALGLTALPAQADAALGPEGVSGKFTAARDSMTADAKTAALAIKTAIGGLPAGTALPFNQVYSQWATTVTSLETQATHFKDFVIAKLKEIAAFAQTINIGLQWTATTGTAPGYATGGVVGGAPGQPVLATVHGGEMVLNAGQQARLAGMLGMSVAHLARAALGNVPAEVVLAARGARWQASGAAARLAAAGRPGAAYEFSQHFYGDIYARSQGEARQRGDDFSYGLRATALRRVGIVGVDR